MKKVVVTGLGCLSAFGVGVPAFAEGLFAGRCAIGGITRFDAKDFRIRVAAEVPGFEAPDLARLDRFSQFAVAASREAIQDAGLNLDEHLRARTAVICGTGVGGQESQDESYRRIYAEGATRLHPLTVPRLMPSAAASHISMDLGVTGPTLGIVSACASGGHALCTGAMMVRAGMADAVLAGGSEACITPGTFRGWEGLRVMASDTCRPFSKGRGGMVIGEGAGMLVLESEPHARARGARIHAELAGIGMSADAGDLVSPSVDGMAAAMRAALQDGGLAPGDVDYVNAHGTGTAQNDPTETRALRQVFGEHAERLAISSSKSMFGHLLGASAALEAVASVLALMRNIAPPTVGWQERDPECDLDYVPNHARPLRIRAAQSNSFGFGGLNAVVIFRKAS